MRSYGETGLPGELIERAAVVAGGGVQDARRGWVGVGELSQSGWQQPGVDVAEQHGVVQPGVSEPVAVAARDADDLSVGAEPSEPGPPARTLTGDVKTERSASFPAPPQPSLRSTTPYATPSPCRTIPGVAEHLGVNMNTDKPHRSGIQADHLSNDRLVRTRAGSGWRRWVSDVVRLMFGIAAVLTAVSHLFSAIGG